MTGPVGEGYDDLDTGLTGIDAGTLRTVTGLPEGSEIGGRSGDGLFDESGVSEPNGLQRSLDRRVPGEKLVYFAGL